MNYKRFFLLLIVLVFFSAGLLFAESPARVPAGFIETSVVREQLFDAWFATEPSRIIMLKPANITDRYGQEYKVSNLHVKNDKLFAVSVLATQAQGIQGTWVLYRRFSDGLPQKIRIYPLDNPNIWVSLTPFSNRIETGRSKLDLMVYGAPAILGAPLGIPFLRLYTAPFSDLVSMTQSTAPWELVNPLYDAYADIESAVETIRNALNSLVYLEDGAFDHDGRAVYIIDGSLQDPADVILGLAEGQSLESVIGGVNCSGFAKWVIDGIVRPVAGSSLFLEPLKRSTDSPETHFTEPYRETRDVFFALDWTRQLASAVLSLSGRGTVFPRESGADVTVEPFSEESLYVPSVGYRAGIIKSLMYALACTEPGHMYLAAVSRERGDPVLRQYHHVAVLLPYFTHEGQFTLALFESAVETSIEEFVSRNEDAYIHLVRVKVPEKGRFLP